MLACNIGIILFLKNSLDMGKMPPIVTAAVLGPLGSEIAI